jgi:vancomycin permeability regulator SanA
MKKIVKFIITTIIITILLILITNINMIISTKTKIKDKKELENEDIDCIIILGAGVRGNNPSPMLEDRLITGIEVYNDKISTKIIVSGDHGQEHYDEVNVMKNYLKNNGIKDENIFMDHAGFSTYDSIYRAKKIFKAKKIVIVTQKYHLYRALYIAEKLNIDAYGIPSDKRNYRFQTKREIREIAARFKDFIKCIFKPKSKCLGEPIPLSNNGNITDDK